jgi:hypothetical protein
MSTGYITADQIQPEMTLPIDGQQHVVDDVVIDDDGDIHVEAETVIGDIGHRSFWFQPTDSVMVLDDNTTPRKDCECRD